MKRHYYAADYSRNFGNEATIIAFTSKAARDAYVERYDWTGSHNQRRVYAITRRKARQMLGPNYLNPGTINCIGGLNVCLSSENEWLCQEREYECQQEMAYSGIPDGASEEIVWI